MDRDFQTQHKLLLLETLYDAGLSLGSLPDEEALVEDVLGRAVGVLDASRGYLATFGEGGARRAEARVGFPRRPSESVVAEDDFLRELLAAETALPEPGVIPLLGLGSDPVHVRLPVPELPGGPLGAARVPGEYVARETVPGLVRSPDRFVERFVGQHRKHRSEDLLLGYVHPADNAIENGG